MIEPEDVAGRRSRLAVVEDLLARLNHQYDLAMSAFKFDEAKELSACIEISERERRALAEALPPIPIPAPAAPQRRPLPLRRRRRR